MFNETYESMMKFNIKLNIQDRAKVWCFAEILFKYFEIHTRAQGLVLTLFNELQIYTVQRNV